MQKTILTGMTPEAISALLPPGKERYRGMQVFRWIHEQGVTSFDEMTNLSSALRAELAEKFSIGAVTLREVLVSADGPTHKFLWELADGAAIESVIIRDGERTTACISSQAGCRMGCVFCRTGGTGFTRNLTTGEIVDQLIAMRRYLAKRSEEITNVVFMGMGEPLDNLTTVIDAIKIINRETGLSIGQRKITVSTCGIPSGILRLAEEFSKIGLAISLNAADDILRERIMPVNQAWPLKDLLAAAQQYVTSTGRRVTFEYILMDGVNDSAEQARQLITIARRVPSKINLIAFNPWDGSPFDRPNRERVERFQAILYAGNVTAMIRKSHGKDILAACGQLASMPKDRS